MSYPPPPVISSPAPFTGNDKVWSILCHLSTFIGLPIILPLAVYLGMKNHSPFAAENAKSALNFHISLFIYSLFCAVLCLILIGYPMLIALWLASIVFAIIGAVKASEGQCYHYPLAIPLIR